MIWSSFQSLNISSSKYSPMHDKITSKHVICVAQVYKPDLQLDEEFATNEIPLFAKTYFQQLGGNPSYVLVLIDPIMDLDLELSNVDIYMYLNVGTTAPLIFIRANKISQLVCFSCQSKSSWEINSLGKIYFWDISNFDLAQINELDRKLHKNFNLGIVIQIRWPEYKSCSPLNMNIRSDSYSCIHQAVGKHLNFTSRYSSNGKLFHCHYLRSKAVSLLLSGSLTPDLWIKNFNSSCVRDLELEYLIPAEIFYQYFYVMVVDPRLSHSFLWSGMDFGTWSSVFLSALATVYAVGYLRIKNSVNVPSHLLVLPFLLEHGQLPVKGVLKIGNRAVFILVIWCLMTIVISNGYKGTLYSLMTAFVPPTTPTSFEEILASKYFLVTTAIYIKNKKSVGAISSNNKLRYDLKNYSNDPTLQKILRVERNLMETVVYTSSFMDQLVFSNTEDGQDVKLGLPNSRERFRVPPTHIFIERDWQVKLYLLLVKLSKSKEIPIMGPRIDFDVVRTPFLVQKNIFSPAITNCLFQMVESGLWDLWLRYHESYLKLKTLKMYLSFEKNKGKRNRTSRKNFHEMTDLESQEAGKLNFHALCWGATYSESSEVILKGLGVNILIVVFAVLGVGWVFSTMLVAFEMVEIRETRSGAISTTYLK
ncbi:unnamed protein product [Allacma fusca]|uniref:Uncharacterized protein n=1 Tax=Allacma fusca TaxID=39272 RepID=A0A8J2NUD7_9HEXA|nr:unnamed protein product [Allacma fusca]